MQQFVIKMMVRSFQAVNSVLVYTYVLHSIFVDDNVWLGKLLKCLWKWLSVYERISSITSLALLRNDNLFYMLDTSFLLVTSVGIVHPEYICHMSSFPSFLF